MHPPTIPPSISSTERFFSITYSLRSVNGHTLELTPTGEGFCLLGSVFALLALLGWGIAWYVGLLAQHLPMMSLGMSTIPTAILVSYLVLRMICGRVRFDNRTRTVRMKPYRHQGWNQWTFDDFLVVQITFFGKDEVTAGASRKQAYQVNLTYRLASGEVAQFPLLSGNRKKVLRKRAKRLAEFMGVPLISETAT